MKDDREGVNPGLSRRGFLIKSGSWAALLAALTCSPAILAAPEGDAFLALSQFLTGRQNLSADLAVKIYTQLSALSPTFERDVNALAQAIQVSSTTSIDDFLATEPTAALRSSMTSIVSAWYLGFTGTPDLTRMADDSRFVTYRGALMFEPTIDATVIPTYARGQTGYWTEPPSTIATD